MITSHDLLSKLKPLLPRCPKITNIIYLKDQLQKTDISGCREDIVFNSFEQVVELGKKNFFEGIFFIFTNSLKLQKLAIDYKSKKFN